MTLSSATIQAGGGIIGCFRYRRARIRRGTMLLQTFPLPVRRGGSWRLRRKQHGNYAVGGNTYDSTINLQPWKWGWLLSPDSIGGAGGWLDATECEWHCRRTDASRPMAGNGSGSGGGGPRRGSIYLTVGTLSGAGLHHGQWREAERVPSAAAAAADAIAIYPAADLFGGTISAYGRRPGPLGWGRKQSISETNYSSLSTDPGQRRKHRNQTTVQARFH